MRGVSEVIAIILILMITISLAGLAYMFMSTTMSDVTSSAGSTVDTTTSSMLTSFTIENMDVAKVYVRNTGQNALTSLSVYVNDEPATYNVTTPIAAGAVGTITIYSFIPDGATVKVTSLDGFSTSKVAQPCEKAIGCWKFDENSGIKAYDSSQRGNTGTLIGSPTWSNGKQNGGLRLDGVDDYVNVSDAEGLDNGPGITVSAWFYINSFHDYDKFVSKMSTGSSNDVTFYLQVSSGNYLGWRVASLSQLGSIDSNSALQSGRWYYAVAIYNGTSVYMYIDGVKQSSVAAITGNVNNTVYPVVIGANRLGTSNLNGTIDEVRIYNRAIY